MLTFLEKLREQHSDDESIRAFTEIENQLRDKKYGLVWEEHVEHVDEMLEENIPVFLEDKSREIVSDPELHYNFVLEGDNLQSLYLLEKTQKSRIDVIYIDPPYNRGSNDFIYDDQFIDKQDAFRHSKWLSFMSKRLTLARTLLTDNGKIFISIDDNEQAQLKLLCDHIFGHENFVATLPTIMNLKGNQDQHGFAGTHEYTAVYVKDKSKAIFRDFSLTDIELDEEWLEDEKGYYKKGATLKRTGNDAPRDRRPTTFFPILLKNGEVSVINTEEYEKIYNNTDRIFDDEYVEKLRSKYEDDGYDFVLPIIREYYASWRWSIDTVRDNADEIIVNDSGGEISFYKKQRPQLGDLPSKKPKSIFYKPEYSSGNGTSELEKILGSKKFENPKPVELIKDLLQIGSNHHSIILDFFAGSGTTAQAVLELNQEDSGNRKFILCTNNENNICDEVTYPRVKTVITGKRTDNSVYSNGMPCNLKYFKCDWTPRQPEDYLLSNVLCLHIKEMIELQNAIKVDQLRNVVIINRDDLEQTVLDPEIYEDIDSIWVNQNILLNVEELNLLEAKNFKYIPKEFFGHELKEAAE